MNRFRATAVFAVWPVLLLGAAPAPRSEKADRVRTTDPYVIVLTESDESSENVLRRYPEITGSWQDIADFNLLRPGARIELSRDMLGDDRVLAKGTDFYGEAEVKRSFDTRFMPLVDHLLLREGDVLRTWRNSGLRVLLDDGNYFVLRSHSRARVDSLGPRAGRDARIKLVLLEGSIWSRFDHKVDGNFEIETPTASTIIRGTDFRVKVEAGDATRVEVLDGTVELRVGDQSVEVPAHRGILSLSGDGPGELHELPAAPAELLEPQPKEVLRAERFEHTFRWTAVAEARAYHVEIAREPTFFDLAAERLVNAAETFVRITDLPPGTFFWRVSAVGADGFEGPAAESSYFVFVRREP